LVLTTMSALVDVEVTDNTLAPMWIG
jgi:hypothetical protein